MFSIVLIFLIHLQEIKLLRQKDSEAFVIDLTTPSREPINLLILTVARRVGGSTDSSSAISVVVEIKECVEGMHALLLSDYLYIFNL